MFLRGASGRNYLTEPVSYFFVCCPPSSGQLVCTGAVVSGHVRLLPAFLGPTFVHRRGGFGTLLPSLASVAPLPRANLCAIYLVKWTIEATVRPIYQAN